MDEVLLRDRQPPSLTMDPCRGSSLDRASSATGLRQTVERAIRLVRRVPATVPLLNALNEDPARLAELIGSPVPDGWPEFPEAIGFTLEHLQNAPEADHAWSMQLFLDDATG